MKKIAVWVAVVLAVFIGVLAIIPFAVDLNKYHATILARIQPYLNRPVDFSDIRLTILSGLGAELKGLRVQDDPAFAKDAVLAAEALQLKVAFLPLLQKKVMIRAVVLKAPTVNIIRAADGVYNFQHILVPQPEKEKEKPSLASTLLIRLIEVKDGRFTYQDKRPSGKQTPFVIEAIDLTAHDVSLFRPITLDLKASIMHAKKRNLTLSGAVGPLNLGQGVKESPVALKASLKDLDLAAMPVQTPWPSGTASFTLDAQGSLAQKVAIKADLMLAGLAASKVQASTSQTDSMHVNAIMQLAYPEQSLQITSGTMDLGGDKGSFSGRVDTLRSVPTWNVTLVFARLSPDRLIAVLPMLAKKLPTALTFKGPAQIKIASMGSSQAFDLRAAADLSAMGIAYGKAFTKPVGMPMTLMNRAEFHKGRIDIQSLALRLDQATATAQGQINTAVPKGSYRFVMQGSNLGLERAARMMPALANLQPTGTLAVAGEVSGGQTPLVLHARAQSKGVGLSFAKAQPAAPANQNKMLAQPMQAQLGEIELDLTADKPAQGLSMTGTLRSRQGTLMNIPYTNLKSSFGYAGQRFAVRSLDFNVFKGSVSSTAAYDLKRKQWEAAPRLVNVQAGNILDSFTTSTGVFSGAMSGAAKARGDSGAEAIKRLSADAKIELTRGEWRNFDLSKTALGSLLAIPGFSQIVGLSEQDVQAYKTTRFDSLAAKLTIAKGFLNISDLAMTGIRAGSDQDATARLSGTLNLSTRALALKGGFGLPKRLSQRLTQKNAAMQRLTDDTQRVALPLTVGGTLQKPEPTVDTRTIKQALAGYYANQAVEKGLKKLKEKTGAGQEVEQLLKGILNR